MLGPRLVVKFLPGPKIKIFHGAGDPIESYQWGDVKSPAMHDFLARQWVNPLVGAGTAAGTTVSY